MVEVPKTSHLDKCVASFYGKNLQEAINSAEAWAIRKGVSLVNYFIQPVWKKSTVILVGYNKPEVAETLTEN